MDKKGYPSDISELLFDTDVENDNEYDETLTDDDLTDDDFTDNLASPSEEESDFEYD